MSLFLNIIHCCFLSQTMLLNTLLLIVIALLIWDTVGASQVWNDKNLKNKNDPSASWNGWSPNDNNDRYRREPLPVTLPSTRTEFKQLWYTKLDGPVAVTPTIYQNRVYVSTFTGSFYCLQADKGNILWQKNLSTIMNNGYNYFSRSSPLIYNDMIILGVMEGSLFKAVRSNGTYVITLDLSTGALRWKTLISTHPASSITATPQLANKRLFVGITSGEEGFAGDPTYQCCSFQGSVVALQASTGKLLWETKMLPDNNGTTSGYSGKLKAEVESFFTTC